jgi:hypothetical protein
MGTTGPSALEQTTRYAGGSDSRSDYRINLE